MELFFNFCDSVTKYDCDGETTICNGQKIFGFCNGKKAPEEKFTMKCKCKKTGVCKLKVSRNVITLKFYFDRSLKIYKLYIIFELVRIMYSIIILYNWISGQAEFNKS